MNDTRDAMLAADVAVAARPSGYGEPDARPPLDKATSPAAAQSTLADAPAAIAPRAQAVPTPWAKLLLPLAVLAASVMTWHAIVVATRTILFPTPWQVVLGIVELAQDGALLKYIVASLFRVTWGFFLALAVGIPFGLVLGWFPLARAAFNPLIQALRPISPIAWIPIAILWFGIKDSAPIFLIFLASVFPVTVSAAAAVQNMQPVYLRAARNFGLTRSQLFRWVIFPAALPQILTGIRIALGVAWLVVVAAEMIAVTSGLGYLINDARNASRYDLVVAGMILIGAIGLALDTIVRRFERMDQVRWGYPEN